MTLLCMLSWYVVLLFSSRLLSSFPSLNFSFFMSKTMITMPVGRFAVRMKEKCTVPPYTQIYILTWVRIYCPRYGKAKAIF